ncbi:MAG: serpin family protein [Eubacterium sp.]|nr:serpin family protein [Eubacterium sp.]
MSRKQILLIRSLSLFLAFTMLTTLFVIPAYAKSKVRLSKAKLTITAKKSTTLKLSGTTAKARWSVSGSKLVTIKTKGSRRHKAVIKAGKKSGTCIVKVKAGNKTLKCKITVKPATDPVPVPVPEPEEEFIEKELSGTSIDKTSSFKSNTVTGKAADDLFTRSMTDAAIRMLKYLCQNEQDHTKNILISPDSILTAMAMAECGARNNTLVEMERAFGDISADDLDAYLYVLNKRLTSSENVKYHVANSLWYKNDKNDITVNDDFIQRNVDFFGAQVFEAPFSSDTLNDINNWVYNHTRGMIPGILNELDTDTVMILLNAIAFEGEWAEKYSEHYEYEPFYNNEGNLQKRVSTLKGKENIYVNIGGADGFIKPYKGNEIAFLGLETPQGMTVDNFIQKLTAYDFITGYEKRSTDYDVITSMPEFKYDYDVSLIDALNDLGINDAFNDFSADFTGITPPEQPLVISDVLHKTHIELDRNGTKAAAVTAVIMDKASAAPGKKPEKSVILDHPFVYAIIDMESGIPLFIGIMKTA